MRTILLSCYRCDPDGVSEAYSGYKWAEILCSHERVIVAVPSFGSQRVGDALTAAGAADFEILPVPMPDIDARLGAFGAAVKPGFFVYESRLLRLLRTSAVSDEADVVWHRTPMSFRHRTRLHVLERPLVIGPVGGGLPNPHELAQYFTGEGLISKLRWFDRFLLASKWWMRPFDRAAVVIATCDYVRDILPSRMASKIVTILDVGVDVTQTPLRAESPPITFLFVGRLVRYKAPFMALKAFERLVHSPDSKRDARLVIVGDGPEMIPLRAHVQNAGLEQCVELTGRLPKPSVLEHYRTADVFLFPSITEASGNVYLEAMSMGLPSIVVDNGGGRYIPDPGCAVQVPLADEDTMIESLTEAMVILYDDAALRATMGASARERVESCFTWKAIGNSALGVLDSLLGGQPELARKVK